MKEHQERGREREKSEGAKAKRINISRVARERKIEGAAGGDSFNLPFELHARSLVIDSVDVLVLQVAERLELHRVVERRRCHRTVFSAGNAERGVRTYLVHFCDG